MPCSALTDLRERIETAQVIWRRDQLNEVSVALPHQLAVKHPRAAVDGSWAWLFPALLPCASFAQQHLTMEVSKSAKQLLGKEGYDPQFGARPLKRAIQEKLLDGEFKPGDNVKVSAQGGELVFQKKPTMA